MIIIGDGIIGDTSGASHLPSSRAASLSVARLRSAAEPYCKGLNDYDKDKLKNRAFISN